MIEEEGIQNKFKSYGDGFESTDMGDISKGVANTL
jgi:hypothetical protein